MSDYELKRINALTEASAINDSDVFAIDSAAGTKKVAWETLKGEVDADISEAVSNKADADGTYPDMAVGSVLGTNTVTDREPYFLRPSASIGDREFDTLVGGTLGWNQLAKTLTSENWASESGVTATFDNGVVTISSSVEANGIKHITAISILTHKYFVTMSAYGVLGQTIRISGIPLDSHIAISHTISNTNTWETTSKIVSSELSGNMTLYALGVGETYENIKIKDIMVIDLTTLFGSTIADYIYSLEQATAGAGVAWVRRYLTADYYACCAPTLKHVSGVSAHVMRDANDNVIGNYPIDSTWVGMGVPKLDSANKLYFDGDTYASDGTVTERYGIRAYQSGDESLADAITDGTNTVYKLTTPTTSSASPFTSPQICDPNGTEEYVSTGLVPVGHETEYVENLADKLTDIPDLPTTAGNYHLAVTVDGGTPSYAWVADE